MMMMLVIMVMDDGENVENVCWKGLNGLQEEVTSEKRGMTVTVCLPTFW